MNIFLENDLSLESQWRALIQFGKNSATYKFAFAKALLELSDTKSILSLSDIAEPFSKNITEHLLLNDKQGNSNSSAFLNECRKFNQKQIDKNRLLFQTEKLGFVNVVDAFQNINGGIIPDKFYDKDYSKGKKEIVLTDNFFKLCEGNQFSNLSEESEARWKLVETAWNLQLNPNMIVSFDENKEVLFIEDFSMKRTEITSASSALNGYQKGKCFYSFQNISINSNSNNICDVDHFLPHTNKLIHSNNGANINGVWNLVLADSSINRQKSAKVPEKRFLKRLFNRNEFYISSKHPLAETIINQTGFTKDARKRFLEKHYNLAIENSIQTWKPNTELIGTF